MGDGKQGLEGWPAIRTSTLEHSVSIYILLVLEQTTNFLAVLILQCSMSRQYQFVAGRTADGL